METLHGLIAFLLGGVGLYTVGAVTNNKNNNVPVSVATSARKQDIDILARTIWGEARGEGYAGMQAVANVIINRHELVKAYPSRYKKRYGATIAEICQKKYQFSVWNKNDPNLAKIKSVGFTDIRFKTAYDLAIMAVNDTLPDITGGADHYHTKAVKPYWSKGQKIVADIGSHNFFKIA